MGTVALLVLVAGPGEILLHDAVAHARERGMSLVDAGVEHSHGDALAIVA